MKKNVNLFFILLVSVLCVGFTACNKDDDESYAKDIAADYIGTLVGTDVTDPTAPVTTTISIKYKSETKIDLSLKQTIAGIPFDIACEALITKKDGIYYLEGVTVVNLEMQGLETSIPIPVAIAGNITVSDVKTAKLEMLVGNEELQPVMPVFPLTVKFEGTNK